MPVACVALIIAYLLGSLCGSLLLSHRTGVDIRARGSGNAGGTNALRAFGWRFALAVVVIDAGKGALAAAVGLWLFHGAVFPDARSLSLACVLVAAFGHTWPIFFGFRGGKGAGTIAGGLVVAWPAAVLPVLAVWILVLVSTGYVGLSTLCAGLALLAFAFVQGARNLSDPALLFALSASVFLFFTHRANLSRLRAGTEHRFERVRIFKRLSASRESRPR